LPEAGAVAISPAIPGHISLLPKGRFDGDRTHILDY
jgi:hypothetical protein